jgi:hypothetical protein
MSVARNIVNDRLLGLHAARVVHGDSLPILLLATNNSTCSLPAPKDLVAVGALVPIDVAHIDDYRIGDGVNIQSTAGSDYGMFGCRS